MDRVGRDILLFNLINKQNTYIVGKYNIYAYEIQPQDNKRDSCELFLAGFATSANKCYANGQYTYIVCILQCQKI